MATNKRITDLSDFTSVLPYASEIFGIYQPLLGWKSKRIQKRFNKGLLSDKAQILKSLAGFFTGQVSIEFNQDCQIAIGDLKPGVLTGGSTKFFDSVLLTKLAEKLPPLDAYKDSQWQDAMTAQNFEGLFREFVVPEYRDFYTRNCRNPDAFRPLLAEGIRRAHEDPKAAASLLRSSVEDRLKFESALAGSLISLAESKNYTALKKIFYNEIDNAEQAKIMLQALSAANAADAYLSLENMDPRDQAHIQSVALSPISVVHLFRQYFFELDTFLGTPVGHVWMSPGSSVELVEVSTRKTIVEKTLETTLEMVTKSERSSTDQDEISDAVKEDNQQDIKFGAGVTATYASVTATANFDMNNSQQQARESTHKRMRQQTEKLSSEIRKNVKSTFKTVTETTDTSSKRYVLSNTTNDLINYEMRRKMRQIGVQVQDIGTYLCWQTYVDDPGRDLGIAKLINLATPADIDNIPAAEQVPVPESKVTSHPFTIPFVTWDGADKDEPFRNGHEVDTEIFEDEGDHVQSQFDVTGIVPPSSDYVLDGLDHIDTHGETVEISLLSRPWEQVDPATNEPVNKPPYNFKINLDLVNFGGKDRIEVAFVFKWKPSHAILSAIETKNAANLDKYNAAVKRANEKAFVDAAKERVKLASKIVPRKAEDLREEERIVVYRRLIQDMLTNGIDMPDDRTRHVVAELINAIFDVDKMLYFVAPEWWRPRLHHSQQQIAAPGPSAKLSAGLTRAVDQIISASVLKKAAQFSQVGSIGSSRLNASSVGWGGIGENGRDNYYITEDSDPAKLGSSLGWLLQLDGDNMRNAFLNAPWVKAVIPIRPGREEAAINWLKGVEGFNGIGADDFYNPSPGETDVNGNPWPTEPNPPKLIDVLMDLAKKIERKHKQAIENGVYPKKTEIADPALVDAGNVVTSTPIDRVYEHGFYALKDGFRANVGGNYEIFDQWIEILPTDQVVPVPVKYDPKTGRQI